MSEKIVYPSLFEKDYILRSLGKIVTDPAVALTELVANAWDAGASHVSIFIPDSANQMLYVAYSTMMKRYGEQEISTEGMAKEILAMYHWKKESSSDMDEKQ